MHPAVFQVFDEICRFHKVSGSVLEIGATPDDSTLLNLPALSGFTKKIGINMAGAVQHKDFAILKENANDLSCFSSGHFDVVLCNSVLEHDRYFWETVAEIRRVVRVGGLVVIGTPGYAELAHEPRIRKLLTRLSQLTGKKDGWALQHSTLTLGVHNFPGDYYRFSEQTYRDVFFEGMGDVEIRQILVPPRIIGSGIRV